MPIRIKASNDVADPRNGNMSVTMGGFTSNFDGIAAPPPGQKFTGYLQRAINPFVAEFIEQPGYPRLAAPRIGRRDWADNDGSQGGPTYTQSAWEIETMSKFDFAVLNGQPRRGTVFQDALVQYLADSKNNNPNHEVYQYIVFQEGGSSLSGTVHDKLVAEDGPPGQIIAPGSPVGDSWYARDGDGNLEVVFGPDPGGNYALNITDYVVADADGNIWPEAYVDSNAIFIDAYVTPYAANPLDGYYCDVFEFRPRENGLNYSGLGTHPNFSDARDNAKDDWNDQVTAGGRGYTVAQKYRDGHRRGLNRITQTYPGKKVGGNCAGHGQEYNGTDPTMPFNENGVEGYYTEYQNLLHMGWLEHTTRDRQGGTFGGFCGMDSDGLLMAFGTPRMATNLYLYQMRHCIAPKHVMMDWKFKSTNNEVDPVVGSNGITSDHMAMNRWCYTLVCLDDGFTGMCNHTDGGGTYDRTPVMDEMGLHNTLTTNLIYKWMGRAIDDPLSTREYAAAGPDPWISVGAEIYRREYENALVINRFDKPGGSTGDPITGDFNIPVDDAATDFSGGSIPGNVWKEIQGVQDPTANAGRIINETNFPSGYPLRRMDGRVFIKTGVFANKIIQKDGNGHYTTIAAAIATAQPGDIFEIRADAEGGSQRFDEQIKPTVSGTASNPITFRSRPGDQIRIVAPSGVGGTFELDGVDYWILHGDPGQRRNLILGDADLTWLASDGGRSVTSDGNIHYLNSAMFNDVRDCLVYGGSSLGASHLNEINEGCQTNRFLRVDFELGGTNDDPLQMPPAERGDLMHDRGTGTIYENVNWAEGGHDNIVLHGHYAVIRGNDFDSDWTARMTGSPGNRCASFSTARSDRGSAPWGPFLIEDCTFRNADESGDTVNQNCHKLTGYSFIVRYNYYWDNKAFCISMSPAATTGAVPAKGSERGTIYNNTMYNNGSFIRIRDAQPEKEMHLNYQVHNNICVEMTSVTSESSWPGEHVFWDCSSIDAQGTPDNWIGAIIAGNRLHATGQSVGILLRGPDTSEDVAGAETTWPAVWTTGNIEGTTNFVNAAARTKAGFALAAGSPDIGAAQPRAQITANSSGSTLTMDSVYWIYDGFYSGASYFGEDNRTDYIKVVPNGLDPATNGTVVRVNFLGRNDGAGTVGIDQSLSVSIGDDVYPVLSDGTTVVDNRGAAQ